MKRIEKIARAVVRTERREELRCGLAFSGGQAVFVAILVTVWTV